MPHGRRYCGAGAAPRTNAEAVDDNNNDDDDESRNAGEKKDDVDNEARDEHGTPTSAADGSAAGAGAGTEARRWEAGDAKALGGLRKGEAIGGAAKPAPSAEQATKAAMRGEANRKRLLANKNGKLKMRNTDYEACNNMSPTRRLDIHSSTTRYAGRAGHIKGDVSQVTTRSVVHQCAHFRSLVPIYSIRVQHHAPTAHANCFFLIWYSFPRLQFKWMNPTTQYHSAPNIYIKFAYDPNPLHVYTTNAEIFLVRRHVF